MAGQRHASYEVQISTRAFLVSFAETFGDENKGEREGARDL